MKTKLEEFREKHYHMPAKELQGRLDQVKKDYEIFFREDEDMAIKTRWCDWEARGKKLCPSVFVGVTLRLHSWELG